MQGSRDVVCSHPILCHLNPWIGVHVFDRPLQCPCLGHCQATSFDEVFGHWIILNYHWRLQPSSPPSRIDVRITFLDVFLLNGLTWHITIILLFAVEIHKHCMEVKNGFIWLSRKATSLEWNSTQSLKAINLCFIVHERGWQINGLVSVLQGCCNFKWDLEPCHWCCER